MGGPLLDKSLDFATMIVLFYEEFSKAKKDTTIAKNYFAALKYLLRSKLFGFGQQ